MCAEASCADELAMLRRQVERERRARRTAEELGESATAQLWQAVQRLEQAESDLRERAATTDLSFALARALRADLDPDQLTDRAVQALGEALHVDRVLVGATDGHGTRHVLAQWHRDGVEPLEGHAPSDEALDRLVGMLRTPESATWIDDLAGPDDGPDDRPDDGPADDQPDGGTLRFRAHGGVPLVAGRDVVGWLVLQTATTPRAWSVRDRGVTEALAHDLSGAMLQAYAHQRQLDTVQELRVVADIKTEFVSRVSHELRTPLTSIRGYAELMAEGEVGDPSPGQVRTLDVILRNCERLLLLTENLLSLSRVDASEQRMVREPVDVVRLLGRVRDVVLTQAATRPLEVEIASAVPGPVVLWGDEAELERVLLNLLGNALKFTPDEGRVALDVETTADSVAFVVSDTGCGIDAADRRRVFDRFYRTHQAQRGEVAGAGLGLALVESIVTAHGGSVEVDSTPGVGSRFRVELPLERAVGLTG